MTKDGRMYCVRWTDENPDEPDEPWETWVFYGAIFTGSGESKELAMQIETIDKVTPEEDALLEAGDAEYHRLCRYAEEGRLRVDDRVLHDTGKAVVDGGDGHRPGTVIAVEADGKVRVRYDALHLGWKPEVPNQGSHLHS